MVKRSNLLLVEDDSSVREALTRVLTGENYTVHGASSGREAVDTFNRNSIEIVVLDLNLGEEDGWDVFRVLKEQRPTLPIIVTSAHSDRLSESSASQANGVLEKPFDLAILLGLLRQVIPEAALSPRNEKRDPKTAGLGLIAGLCLALGAVQAQAVPTPIHISPLTVTNGTAMIQWTGGNTSNLVQSTEELGSGQWTDVDGPTTSHTMTAIAWAPKAFYRVVQFANTTGDSVAPTAPAGLSVVLNSPTDATLTWSPSTDFGTGLMGYNVYRNGVFLKQVQTTYTQDSGLVPRGQYSYQVCAVDWARNQSPKSNLASLNPSPACTYSLAPTSAAAPAAGGSASVSVTAGIGCAWDASSGADWIYITSSASGIGNGTISYSVTANASSSPRTGWMTIAGQSFMITQDGVGGVDGAAPTVTMLAPAGGTSVSGSVNITANVSDNVGVSSVQFYVDNLGGWVLAATQAGSGANGNYTASYNTVNVANGPHNFLVRAYDAAGNTSYSMVGVTVNNFNADPGNMMWAKDVGQSSLAGEAQNSSIKTDSQGNQIVVGKFSGTVNFSGTSLTSVGGYDLFVAKYSANGALLWIRSYGGPYDNLASGVAVDSADNIIVTGQFVGTMNLGGGLLVSGGGTSNPDMFVAKFNPSGTHVWSKTFGGAYGNYANAVAVDRNNDVLIAGQYNFQVNFGGGVVQSAGGADGFVVKFGGQNGAYIWAHSFGGAAYDNAEALSVDGNGDVVVSGFSTGSMDFGGGVRANNGGSDAFLAKFSGSTGAHIWSQLIGSGGNDEGACLSVDSSGNPILVGTFNKAITLGGVTLNAPLSTAMLIVRFDASGRVLWAKSVGGQSSISGSISPRSAAVDSAGNVVITGNATGEADFGNGVITAGTGTIFLAKYSSSGGYLWAKRFASTGWSSGTAVAVDSGRNIVTAGSFAGNVNFDGTQLNSVSTLTKDAYLVKLSP